jgi:hypothetical protein
MPEQREESAVERHRSIAEVVARFITVVVCGMIISLCRAQGADYNYTEHVYVAEDLTDTGIYLPAGEGLPLISSDESDTDPETVEYIDTPDGGIQRVSYIDRRDHEEFNAYGKHYVFATKVGEPVEQDGQYWYERLSNLDIDPSEYSGEQYYLYADEPLVGIEPDDYVVFDGLVCGYYYVPTGYRGGHVGDYYPILRVCDAQVLSKEELYERLEQWEWFEGEKRERFEGVRYVRFGDHD